MLMVIQSQVLLLQLCKKEPGSKKIGYLDIVTIGERCRVESGYVWLKRFPYNIEGYTTEPTTNEEQPYINPLFLFFQTTNHSMFSFFVNIHI